MKNLLFLFLICLLWACQQEPTSSTTPSGYAYTHHIKNNGPTPQPGEEAVFIVDIRNEKEVVNSSRQQPRATKVLMPEATKQIKSISPIIEALSVMSIGDSLTVQQSTDSFPRKPPGFENSPFVYYDVILKDIISKEEVEKERAEQLAKVNAAKAREAEIATQTQDLVKKYNAKTLGNLQTTDSNLKYHIIEEGNGKQVENGSLAQVHYYGVTMDGNMFDNSFQRGMPYPVPVGRGQVIRGWDEGLQLFKGGTKAILFIPSELGYGATGSPPSIPPNAELAFYVEIAEVE